MSGIKLPRDMPRECPLETLRESLTEIVQELLKETLRETWIWYTVNNDYPVKLWDLDNMGADRHRITSQAESDTLPFVINIWLEQTAEEGSQAVWRGRITYVPSGERRYLKDLDDIIAYILSYLGKTGREFGESVE